MKFTKPGLFIITALLLAMITSCGLVKNEDREHSTAPSLKTGTVIFSPVLEEDGEMDCAASGISYFEVTLKREGEESALKGPFSCEEKVIKLTYLTPGYRDITLEGKNIDGITLYTETIVNYHVRPEFLDAGEVILNAIDRQAPSVVSVLPTEGATVQTENLPIAVEFNEPIDGGTLTEATFTLSDGVNLISGTITYNMVKATFEPSIPLKKGTTYVATVTTGVKDLSENPLPKNYSWSFSTATGYIDTLPPEVVSTNPTDGVTDVPVNVNITATFNEPMDPATIDTTSFLVSDGAVNIEGAVTYDQNTKTATFSPTTPFNTDKQYTVTVTEGAKDSAGNSLTAFPWAFRTTVDQVPVVTVCPFIPGNEAKCDSFTIQGGIDLAESGTTIRVAEGSYGENITLKSGITLEGGWDNSFSVRNTSLYKSIINGSGSPGNIVFGSAVNDVKIDGFTIQKGFKSGIHITNGSTIVVSSNRILNNKGGIYISTSKGVSILNNQITNNSNYCVACSMHTGGIYIISSDAFIGKNTIAFNTISGWSGISGGGINVSSSKVIISKNFIHDNTIVTTVGRDGGGGIHLVGDSTEGTLENNIISNNSSNDLGGGIFIRTGNLPILVTNNTITKNTAKNLGAGIQVDRGIVAILNTILWGNSGVNLAPGGGSVSVSYSNTCDVNLMTTPYSGSFNKCEDPLFIDPSLNNFHLQQASPMIDMATPNGAPDYDIDGDARPQGQGIDIGADEVVVQ